MEALQRLHNRGSISTGYDIDNSLKFESDNAEYLMAEGRSQGNQQTWTFSIWLKRTEVNNGFVAQYIMSAGSDGKLSLYFRDDASYPGDQIFIYMDEGNSQKWLGRVNESFRDPSAWYHLVFTCDTTDSTAADRTKLYINGERRTITYNDTMNVNTSTRVGDNGGKFALGARIATPGYNFNGYMAEAVLVDGSALTPTSFGEYDDDSGIWKPKDVSDLSLGTTGFHMNFDDSSNVGAVQRGNNGGNFDKYNLSAADQATDTPTNNFCTLNPLDQEFDGTNIITDGATNVRIAGSGSGALRGTYAVSQGKWYWEIKITPINTSSFYGVWGIYTADKSLTGYPGSTTGSWGIYGGNGNAYYNGSSTTFYTDSIASGDIFSYAFNADDGQLFLYKNGSIIGSNSGDLIAASGTSFPADFTYYSPTFADGTNSPAPSGYLSRFEVNFGGFTNFSIASSNTDDNGYGTFEYAPPSGYYALCTKNLEEFG